MSKYKHQAVIDEFRLLVDDVIEEMESYIEEDNNMSYQDELHRRIMEASKQFLDEQLSKKEEIIEEMEKQAQKERERFMKEIRYLREAQPYRGKPSVTVEKDDINYRVMIIEAWDTPDGIVIRGKI